jgi:FtsH-binding integral membrane protein
MTGNPRATFLSIYLFVTAGLLFVAAVALLIAFMRTNSEGYLRGAAPAFFFSGVVVCIAVLARRLPPR